MPKQKGKAAILNSVQKNAFVMINRSSGEVEWILPVLYWLVRSDVKVTLIFMRETEYAYCLKSPFIKNIIKQCEIQMFCMQNWWQYCSSVKRFTFGLWFFIHHCFDLFKRVALRHSEPHIIHAHRISQFFKSYPHLGKCNLLLFDNSFYRDVQRESSICQFVGKNIITDRVIIFPHAPIFSIIDDAEADAGFTDVDVKTLEKTDTKYWQYFKKFASKTIMISDNLEALKGYIIPRGMNVRYVGCPRFQLWWQNAVSDDMHGQTKDKKKVLIMSKLNGRLFKEVPSIKPDILLQQIIESCEHLGLSWQLKMHPRDDAELIQKIISRVSDKQLDQVVCSGSVFDLQGSFSLSISIPSSATLDTVAANIPTIEYYDYAHADVVKLNIDSEPARLGIVKYCYDQESLTKLLGDELSEANALDAMAKSQRAIFNKYYNKPNQHAGETVKQLMG